MKHKFFNYFIAFTLIFNFIYCKKRETITIDSQTKIEGYWQRDSIANNEEYYEFTKDNFVTIYKNDTINGRTKSTYPYKLNGNSLTIDYKIYNIIIEGRNYKLYAGTYSTTLFLKPIQYNEDIFKNWLFNIKIISTIELPNTYFGEYEPFAKEGNYLYFFRKNNKTLCKYNYINKVIEDSANIKLNFDNVSSMALNKGYIYFAEYGSQFIYRIKGLDSASKEDVFTQNGKISNVSKLSINSQTNELYVSTFNNTILKSTNNGFQVFGSSNNTTFIIYDKNDNFIGMKNTKNLVQLNSKLEVIKTYLLAENMMTIANFGIFDDRLWIIKYGNIGKKIYLSEARLE